MMMNNFENIKMIALDMDGTAMNDESIISPYSKDIISKISEKYLLVPTTGRGAYRLVEDHIGCANIQYIIGANGALVVDRKNNKNIFNFTISYDIAAKIIEESLYPSGMVYIHCNDNICTHLFHCENREVFENKYCLKFKCNDINKYEDDLANKIINEKMDVLKIGIKFSNEYDTLKCKRNIIENYPSVNVFDTDINALEITNKQASKGQSLEKLCNYLNIDSKEVCAIGDNGNDVSMIKWAGIGVAMDNAIGSAKEVANLIIGNNNEDGAAKFLEEYFLKG